MLRALLVGNDGHCFDVLAKTLNGRGFKTETARDLHHARVRLLTNQPHVAFFSPSSEDDCVLELAQELRDIDTPFVLMSDSPLPETAASDVDSRFLAHLPTLVDSTRLEELIDSIHERYANGSAVRSDTQPDLKELIVGESPAMEAVYEMIRAVAPTDATVLIQGESGVGKEVIANAIHVLSSRRGGPFLAINCGAFPENLIASELFGHERGSFSGADHQHRGYFERAAGGTLFLDEITEMPLELQAHLLRILETGVFLRVGGTKELSSDARIIAATNRSPEAAIANGRLREDLFYRLQVFPIHVPPLRDRIDDIPQLALHFLAQLNQSRKTEKTLSTRAQSMLSSHSWPGNVRELKNTIERAHLLAGDRIDVEHLIFQPVRPERIGLPKGLVGRSLEEIEREVILATLKECHGNKRRAAAMLGVSLKTLYNRLKKYDSTQESGLHQSSQ